MQLYPSKAENLYKEYLLSILDTIKKIVTEVLLPYIDPIARQAQADSWVDDATTLLSQVKIGYDKKPIDPTPMLSSIAGQTNVWNNKEWKKTIKTTLGVDVFTSEPKLNDRLAVFAQTNKTLIKGYTDDAFKNIDVTVMNALRQGKRHEEISAALQDTFNVSTKRAKLIARDQVSKLNGDLTQMRQQNAGIRMYIWRAQIDERTRATHRALDGKLCRWDDFKVYSDDEGKTWKDRSDIDGYNEGHPGDDYQCRCYAEPYMADINAILSSGNTAEPIPLEPEPVYIQPPVTPKSVPIPKQPVLTEEEQLTQKMSKYVTLKDDLSRSTTGEVYTTLRHIVKNDLIPPGVKNAADVHFDGRLSRGTHGQYSPTYRRIKINKKNVDKILDANTAAHEYGHHIDRELGLTHWGMRVSGLRTSSTTFTEYTTAIKKTKAYNVLREAADTGLMPIPGTTVKIKLSRPILKHIHYLLDPEELWARSYSQYVATTTDAALDMRKALEFGRVKYKGNIHQYSQWSDTDFEEVFKVIDKIVKKGV